MKKDYLLYNEDGVLYTPETIRGDFEAYGVVGENGVIVINKKSGSVEAYWMNDNGEPTHIQYGSCRRDVQPNRISWTGRKRTVSSQDGTVYNFNAVMALMGKIPQARIVREFGRGYSGGHVSAEKYGWHVEVPGPVPHAIAVWDETTQGAFTGYYPVTASLVA